MCSPTVRWRPSPCSHAPPIVDQTSLIPNVSTTLAPHAGLDLASHRRQAGARLAGRHDVADAERARLHAELARPRREVGGERERSEDRRDAEPRDQLEQPARLPDPDGDDGRSARLERHVIGDAARVERVVQAVRDHVVRPQPGDPERLAAHRAVGLVIGSGEAHRDRLAGRPRRHVHADQALARRAQVRAERRISALALAQLLLGRERQPRQVVRTAHLGAHAAQALRVERARRLEVGELLAEGAHSRGGRSPAAALSSVASTVRP